MRKMKIVADSSCDIFTLKNVDFKNAPMKVVTDEREFVDDENLNVSEMSEYLFNYKGKSKSSCPNIGDWLNAFGDADDVICLTITSGLSGSYNSACSAKEIYETEHEGKRVFVMDTLSAGAEITLLLEKIDEYAGQGLSYEEICEKIVEYRKKTGLGFMLKTLRTFANNGRVSPIIAKIAGIIGIVIVGKGSDKGTLESTHKTKGERRSLATLFEDIQANGYRGGKVSIGHCGNEAGANDFKTMILSKYPNAEIEIHELKGLCSFYAEKGGVLVGYEKE